ncbi:enoyl-CoA hydratase-related protein [Rhodococcus sp. T7]|uniref:enoyl-CoA hydratase-related protein n=1 Tax=Rhodococcus sp. T7 TaxID=627444 RepID=UPI00135BC62E|nr:enoyl-CoA hydratase-related protein [Rhodococcus sp. T7]KAF0956999.1 putative enoyl-CoA hydratase echA8 [Rhodococcus sp. T7]KAF0958704.1 putative enoyl-CoA hydratase echA8 [Rhodococcus sp. T7]
MTAAVADRAEEALVSVERDGRVAILQLNRPRVLNALSPEMMDAVLAALRDLDADPEVGAVVVAGHDRAFVAGADLSSMQHRQLADVLTAQASRFWFRLCDIEVPLVAAVSGPAFGGGCELALACDLVVASSTARFSQAEIKVGIMPGGGGTQRLARTLGKHKAMELVLTGRAITAEEAERLGLVNRVVPEDTWRQEAINLARQVAAGPPVATRLAKKAVLAAEETPLSSGMQLERRLMELAFASEDRVEGMTAFLEKRVPRWAGI